MTESADRATTPRAAREAPALTEAVIAKAVRACLANRARDELRDPGQSGVWLRVGKTGIKTWTLRARDHTGRLRSLELGQHPTMGLAQARETARALRVQLRNGADPTAARRAARAAAKALPPAGVVSDALKAVLAIYEKQRGCDLKSWAHSRKRVDRVFAAAMARSVQSLTAIDLQVMADSYPARQSASFAVRTLRPALAWCSKRGLVPAGLVEITQPVAVRRRRRALSVDELAELLPHLRVGRDLPHYALMHFLLLTLARLGEATAARWQDVDFDSDVWTIPETKSGEPHRLPLSSQARDLLCEWGPGEPEALIFASSAGAALSNWHRWTKRVQAESGVGGWHRHDLRRSAATLLGNLGTEPHLIEAALNHTAIHSRMAATYNRSRYEGPVRAALQRLGDMLDTIEHGGTEIVPLAAPG